MLGRSPKSQEEVVWLSSPLASARGWKDSSGRVS